MDKLIRDTVIELSCNIDDMTGEEIGYTMDVLFENGALDVYYTPIYMKKNRPGTLLRCLCKEEDLEKFQMLILKHTTTRGIRYTSYDRVKLDYSFEEIDTEFGPVKKKINSGNGITKTKYEFDDLKRIAKENNLSIVEVKNKLPE